MPKISRVVASALLAYSATTSEGFGPSFSVGFSSSSVTLPSYRVNTALQISVVSSFITKDEAECKINNVFETQTPESVGVSKLSTGSSELTKDGKEAGSTSKKRNNRNRRKHNYSVDHKFRHEQPDTDFYTLHSSAVSHLQKDMPINDIMRAIKRAQNLHDAHDLSTIAAFLMNECDEHWGYGFRGSLLSRTAVAGLHMNEVELANQAIETRRVYERASMQPYESAAIVRGLMRVQQVDEAWNVLEDELRLPLAGSDWSSAENREVIKHRARVLASIVSRHFHSGEPQMAARALTGLTTMGDVLPDMVRDELHLPWSRLVNAASDCKYDVDEQGECSLPSDLSELVFEAIGAFPCPGGEEECGIDDYLYDE